MTLVEALQPESPYVFYSDDHGFCINTADMMDILNKEPKYHWITLCKDCKHYKGAIELLEKIESCEDAVSRKAAIDALEKWESESIWDDYLYLHRDEPGCEPPSLMVKRLPSVSLEPSQVARDIATIIENEKDMRVIAEQRIRCVHCKRYERHNHRCKWWNHGVSNVDWCSYAVRKDGET